MYFEMSIKADKTTESHLKLKTVGVPSWKSRNDGTTKIFVNRDMWN